MLASEADGMHGNALAADGCNGIQIDAARVVGAVAQENDRAQGQRRRFRQHTLERIADARGLAAGVERVGAGDALAVLCRIHKAVLEISRSTL